MPSGPFSFPATTPMKSQEFSPACERRRNAFRRGVQDGPNRHSRNHEMAIRSHIHCHRSKSGTQTREQNDLA
jgi:hypothetical protein